MALNDGFMGAIGNTPLIRLQALSKETGCEILGKAEFMNPGGSVKDRAAKWIVLDAERCGTLKPGGTVVEGTAGNTGIGLAHVCNARGYKCVIVMPDNQAAEKYQIIEALGADLRKVPAVPYSNPNQYQKVAGRLAAELPNAIWANQFDNTANRLAHYQSTGPEIWEQTNGEVTAFVSSVGTGGTLAGTALYLKERNPRITTVCADPYGAAMWSWFNNGNTDTKDGDSFAEGIGQTRVTRNLEGIVVDCAYRIKDQTALTIVYQLLREEGLFLGLSSGINIAGAVRCAKERGAGQTIVTLLCDSGMKYQSKLFNPAWLKEHNLDPSLPIESALA
jgi:cysteine synthase